MKEEVPELRSEENSAIAPLLEGLSDSQKNAVTRLLERIPVVARGYPDRRFELGECLYELHEVLAVSGHKGRFQRCLEHLRIPKGAANNLIADHCLPRSD